MSSEQSTPPRLVLLEGNGEGNGRARLSLGSNPTESIQLSLPIAHPGKIVLYGLSLRRWADESLIASTLRSVNITAIFDIRFSASFGGAVIDRSRWLEMLGRLNIKYFHLPELANSFGSDGNRRSDFLYRRYLATQEKALQRIVTALSIGSVAVMVFGSVEEEGDRAILMEHLLAQRAHQELAFLKP